MRNLFNKIFIAIITFIAINLSAQESTFTSYDLLRLNYVVEASISPNGKYIAYTVHSPRPLSDGTGVHYRHLYLYDLEYEESTELIGGSSIIKSISWMSDSKNVTFISKMYKDNYSQVHSISIEDKEIHSITNTNSSVLRYQISKDGNWLGYVAKSLIDEEKQKLLLAGFDAEIFEEEYLNRNLYIYNLKSMSMAPRQITNDVSVFDFQFSPDGKTIAAFIADKNLVDYSYMFKDVYLIDILTGERTLHLDNPGKIDQLEWSPDGKHLAFIAASSLHDAVTGSMFVTDVPNTKTFDELFNYAANKNYTIRKLHWENEETLLFLVEDGVNITLNKQKIEETERTILIKPGNIVSKDFDVSGDLIALAGNTSKHPDELFSYTCIDGRLSKLTDSNPWMEDIRFADQEMVSYSARDGLEIQGVLNYPLNYVKGKKYPLIVFIHGGPEHAVLNGWQTAYNRWGQIAAAKGFFVFMPNYRSSSSRGIDFTMEGFGKLLGSEFEDVLDGINYLISSGMVDKNKVGIGGGSYGGYFSAWAATKYSDRFAAAVVFVGIADQVSKRLSTDIPFEDYYVHWGFWTYENEAFVWERSPVRYARNNKTPTLILGGTEDERVHPSQSLELYRGLKLHGNAPVRLVRYPGEKHGNKKNTSRLDYNLRAMRWFEYYLKGDSPRDKMPDKYLDISFD